MDSEDRVERANSVVDVQRLFEGAKEYADLSGRPQPVLADLHAAHQEAPSGSGSSKRLRRESKRRRNRTWRRNASIPSSLHPIYHFASLRTGPHWSAPSTSTSTSHITYAVIVRSYTPRKDRSAAVAASRDHLGSAARSIDHPGGYKAGHLELRTSADSDSDSESARGSADLRAGMGSWSAWEMDLRRLGSCERAEPASSRMANV